MQNIKNYSIIAILTLSVIAGIFSNIPLSYSQNDTMAMGNMTEEEEYATTEAVRDSVTELLQDKVIPGGDFMHLYDSTPYHIVNGHIALKAPCEDDSTTPVQILIGSAPNMTAATLENIAPLSTPGAFPSRTSGDPGLRVAGCRPTPWGWGRSGRPSP